MGIQKYNTETYQEKLNEKFPELLLVEEYTSYDSKLLHHCNVCNGDFYAAARTTINGKGKGCPYCKNRRILIGFNDIQTTNPEIADLLVNDKDKVSYTFGTTKKLLFKCKDCNHTYQLKPSLVTPRYCKYCRDGVSIPEKLMLSFLTQLNIDYIYQLSKLNFEWCKNYRYDFYFELNNKKYIIETHGQQHYVDRPTFNRVNHLSEIQENDLNKKNNALNNIDEYIELDCSKTDILYFENSVKNSVLSKIFNLSDVSFEQCFLDSLSSKKIDVCKDFSNGMNSKQLREKYSLSKTAVKEYLEFGRDAGICKYNKETNRLDAMRKSVVCLNNMKVYESVDAACKKTGVSSGAITDSCKNHRELSSYKTTLTKWMYYDEYKQIDTIPEYFTNDNSRKKVKCINTGEIFESLKDATDWCGVKGINVALNNKNRTCGKHPVTGEGLKWEYA